MPYFVLSTRAKNLHGLKQVHVKMVSSTRVHIARLNHAAIATACGLNRDVVVTGLKELLWVLLESMANQPEVLINIGAGDIRSKHGTVSFIFEGEAGHGSKGMRQLCPLSSNSEVDIDRLSIQSSASTLRPPSAAGTDLDWDSLVTTRSQVPVQPTILEASEEEAEDTKDMACQQQLPPIGGLGTHEDSKKDALRTEPEHTGFAKDYLMNHKSTKEWTTNEGAKTGHEAYLDRVFDRYEDALLRSETQLRQEMMQAEQATVAEKQLRDALESKKVEERRSVAKSLKSQMKLREKEHERQRLEAMILSEPAFPSTERETMSMERQKQLALRSTLDDQVAFKARSKVMDSRYDRIQESRKQADDANRYFYQTWMVKFEAFRRILNTSLAGAATIRKFSKTWHADERQGRSCALCGSGRKTCAT